MISLLKAVLGKNIIWKDGTWSPRYHPISLKLHWQSVIVTVTAKAVSTKFAKNLLEVLDQS